MNPSRRRLVARAAAARDPNRTDPGIDPADPRLAVGAWVLYRAPHEERAEDGIVTSLRALARGLVHVRFRGDVHAKACRLADLRWPT